MRKYIFLLLCGLFTSCAAFKKQVVQPEIVTDDFKSMPKLSYEQLLADHDSLVSYIRQVSPIIYYNETVRGISFNHYAKTLRRQISPATTMGNYLIIVEQTLNAAQDGHSGRLGSWQLDLMKNNWIPNKIITDIDTGTIALGHEYEKYVNQHFYAKLNLNLVYTEGEYYNLLPFSYKEKVFPAAMKLVSCNGAPIHEFVKRQIAYISPLRWDRAKQRMYHERFYRPAASYKKGKLSLVFMDNMHRKFQLDVIKGDTVVFQQKINKPIGYNDEQSPLVTHYFEREGIFYAKMPMMVEAYGDSLAKMLQPIITKQAVKAIVLDVRGNPGGSDNTYSNFLKRIVKDTLCQNVVVARNFSPYNQRYFKINADSVANRKNYSFQTPVATLKAPQLYYISIPDFRFVVPDSVNYGFSGKVYVLQDRYIYSSASNLSNLASKNEQLVSIGQTPDLLGGLQTNPTILQLPYSKLIFRIEPQIDFTDAKSPADAFQNHVEHPVSYTIGDLYQRVTASEDLFGKAFMYQNDPMFKKVLELEQIRRQK